MTAYIVVLYREREYEIYSDGIVYNTTDDKDIPSFIFSVRDLYVRR